MLAPEFSNLARLLSPGGDSGLAGAARLFFSIGGGRGRSPADSTCQVEIVFKGSHKTYARVWKEEAGPEEKEAFRAYNRTG